MHPDFNRYVSTIAGATLGAHALSVLALPVLTKLYGPEDWGVLGMYTGIVSVVSTTAMLRYDAAVAATRSTRRAQSLTMLCVTLLLAACAGLVLLSLATGYPQPKLIKVSFALLVGGVFVGGLLQIANYAAVRIRAYSRISASKSIQGGGQVVGQLLGSLLGPHGLIAGDLIGRLCGLASLVIGASTLRPTATSTRSIVSSAKKYAYLPRTLGLAHIVGMASAQMPVVLFPALFGQSAAGQYFLAYRLTYLPATLLAAAAAPVVLGELAVARGTPCNVKTVFLQALKRLSRVIVPVYAVALLIGPFAVVVLLGESWEPAASYVRWLAPAAAIWAVANPLSSVLVLADRGLDATLFSVADITVKGVVLAIGASYLSAELTVILLAASSLVLTAVSMRRFYIAALSAETTSPRVLTAPAAVA